jgi:hypothetical protein
VVEEGSLPGSNSISSIEICGNTTSRACQTSEVSYITTVLKSRFQIKVLVQLNIVRDMYKYLSFYMQEHRM